MPNFDDANRATEELFENESQEVVEEPVADDEEQVVEQTEEQPVATEEDAVLDEAVNTAEVAAQAAQEREIQLQEALREIELIKAQNQSMQGTIAELSKKNEENLLEEVLQMPTLDINGLAFADDETIQNAQNEYAQKMSAFVKAGVMKEIAPFVEQAKAGMYEKEKGEMLQALAQTPELAGINDMLPQLEKIIANNRWLQSDDMPIEEKFINAYAIARGVNAINTPPEEPKELTDDDLMKLYDENPTFQELIEKKRLDAIKNSQQVPPFSASSGAVNAALNIKEKPKTFEEASERTRRMFGMD